MRNLILTLCFAAGALLSGCRKKDVTTVVISVPEMKNMACAEIVIRAVNRVERVPVSDMNADIGTHEITVTYDTMQRGLKNIEMAIAGAGFQANEVPANAEAAKKLPEACFKPGPGGKE